MRWIVVIGCAAALAGCAAAPLAETPPPTVYRPARAAAPTTRLVLPRMRGTGELDCADFDDQATAQAALRARPSDPDRLDADRDGIACEDLGPPRDEDPVAR